MGKILLVHEAPDISELVTSALGEHKHSISYANTVKEANHALVGNQYEVAVTGENLRDGNGFDVLTTAHQADPNLSVVFLAGSPSLDLAVESMRRGAFDFLAQPLAPELLRDTIQRGCDYTLRMRERRNGNHRARLDWIDALPASFDLRALLSTIEKAVIERTLEATGGAQAEAARRLRLSRSDLSYKLLKYELRKETTVS
jgi:DNA-binding NtrC family response regulator